LRVFLEFSISTSRHLHVTAKRVAGPRKIKVDNIASQISARGFPATRTLRMSHAVKKHQIIVDKASDKDFASVFEKSLILQPESGDCCTTLATNKMWAVLVTKIIIVKDRNRYGTSKPAKAVRGTLGALEIFRNREEIDVTTIGSRMWAIFHFAGVKLFPRF
jgi:hypothetical protein